MAEKEKNFFERTVCLLLIPSSLHRRKLDDKRRQTNPEALFLFTLHQYYSLQMLMIEVRRTYVFTQKNKIVRLLQLPYKTNIHL